MWRPGWYETNSNWMTSRQRLSLRSQVESFFLTLSPLLLVLALPTFLSQPVFATWVSWYQITCPLLSTWKWNVCCSAFAEIQWINFVCQYLTVEATKDLIYAFVLSDCCNSLLVLSGCPLYILSRLTFPVDYKKFGTLRWNWFSKRIWCHHGQPLF